MKKLKFNRGSIICIAIIIICMVCVCNNKVTKADGIKEDTSVQSNTDNISNEENKIQNGDNSIPNEDSNTIVTDDISNIEVSNEENSANSETYNIENVPNDEDINKEIVKNPIIINEKSICLSIGETKTLTYSKVKYASSNKDIIQVSANGCIKALKGGIASVIVSNESDMKYIQVYVYDNTSSEGQVQNMNTLSDNQLNESITSNESVVESSNVDKLRFLINNSADEKICVSYEEHKTVSAIALETLYKKRKTLEVDYGEYKVIIEGVKLNDISKDMTLDFDIEESFKYKESYEMKVNQKLPGKVVFKSIGSKYKKKYIYIYNVAEQKYKLLSDNEKGIIDLKNGEKYLITDKDLDKYVLDIRVIILIVVVFIVLIIIYICVKKRYWFW